jgi:hypothetical protein
MLATYREAWRGLRCPGVAAEAGGKVQYALQRLAHIRIVVLRSERIIAILDLSRCEFAEQPLLRDSGRFAAGKQIAVDCFQMGAHRDRSCFGVAPQQSGNDRAVLLAVCVSSFAAE